MLLHYFHHFSSTHPEQMVKSILANDCHTGPLLPTLSSKDQKLDFWTTEYMRTCPGGKRAQDKASYVTKPVCHVMLKKVVSMSITTRRVVEMSAW